MELTKAWFVVVALLSQVEVEGHQSAVMSENWEAYGFGVEDSKQDRIVLAMYDRVSE